MRPALVYGKVVGVYLMLPVVFKLFVYIFILLNYHENKYLKLNILLCLWNNLKMNNHPVHGYEIYRHISDMIYFSSLSYIFIDAMSRK
jgi:hypothetical protein